MCPVVLSSVEKVSRAHQAVVATVVALLLQQSLPEVPGIDLHLLLVQQAGYPHQFLTVVVKLAVVAS